MPSQNGSRQDRQDATGSIRCVLTQIEAVRTRKPEMKPGTIGARAPSCTASSAFEAAQLDLIAGRPLRDVANKLVREHENVLHWLRPASGASDWLESLVEQNNKIVGLHTELVEKTRADPGVDRGSVQHR